MADVRRVCCPVILIFITAVATTAVALGISYSYSKPHIYIQDLYVPALVNKATTFNTSVFVDLKFKRRAALTRPHYKDFQMTLVYGQDTPRIPVGTHMVQGFNMGRKRRVHVKAAVEAVGMPWQEASRAVSRGNVVAMRVELMSPDSDETLLVAHVAVDASGHMVSKNPIEFRWPCSRGPCWRSGKGVYCGYCI